MSWPFPLKPIPNDYKIPKFNPDNFQRLRYDQARMFHIGSQGA